MNILLIEDETRVADFIRRGLNAEGWSVTHAPTGETGVELCDTMMFDVIVLDLMLPRMSGQEVCKKLRARRNQTPILMLSALDAADERIRGLNLGADDYLPKPFDFDELVARLSALHRRATAWSSDLTAQTLDFGGIRFDRQGMILTVDDRQIDLSQKEREILLLLLFGRGKVFSREHILNTVWGVNEDPLTNVVDVYIGRLRRKLGAQSHRLATIRQVGFRFD